jgi:hypothetical protein
VGPLGQHRLVAEDQVLVDEGRAELLGIDRPSHGCYVGHARTLCAVPRSWIVAMTILVICLLASIVIALVHLL